MNYIREKGVHKIQTYIRRRTQIVDMLLKIDTLYFLIHIGTHVYAWRRSPRGGAIDFVRIQS